MNPWKIDQIALEEFLLSFRFSYDDYDKKLANSFSVTQTKLKVLENLQDSNKKH